jgi:NadR type nicotinamide-nucleotide adenylyltransferase
MKKIAITGPESTGKTWLARELAAYYKTMWVPEFAREYLFRLGRPYVYDDILLIAQKQFLNNGQAIAKANPYLFCDTELIVTKIWCDVKFGKCHPWIEEHILKQNFDLYLVTDTDLPWEPDPQREHPHMREHLMELYINELEIRNFPFHIVDGQQEDRLKNAIKALGKLTVPQ